MNYITEFLDLIEKSGKELEIVNIEIDDVTKTKTVTVKNKEDIFYCEDCGSRIRSKGFNVRKLTHSVLQDGYKVIIILKEKKGYCSCCTKYFQEEFTFAPKYSHTTNIMPILILNELKNLSNTCADIAERYHVSDAYVHSIVLRYLEPKRKPLPKYLCVDEVFLDIDYKHKYALVLLDFETGEIIDLLPSRRKEETEKYFLSIPKDERDNVEVLICDMYNPYINYTKDYFHKAICSIDSFHIIQLILHKINIYINNVKKKYQELDDKERKLKNLETNKDFETAKVSKEVYLLNKYRFFLLMNKDNIEYSNKLHYSSNLKVYVDTYRLEDEFMKLDKNFVEIRVLKEMYIEFNKTENATPDERSKEFLNIVDTYEKSHISLFREVALTLKTHMDEIYNSFTYVNGRRLSNGPIEGFNRKPKDLKRDARGFNNFDYVRNRLIWNSRDDEPILAVPKSYGEIKELYKTNKVRGSYNK